MGAARRPNLRAFRIFRCAFWTPTGV